MLGIKFRPGGFRPLIAAPVSSLRSRVVPAADVLTADTRPLVAAVLATNEAADQAAAAQAWLAGLAPPADPLVDEAASAVAAITANPSVVRVEELARMVASSTRSLQRLFRSTSASVRSG